MEKIVVCPKCSTPNNSTEWNVWTAVTVTGVSDLSAVDDITNPTSTSPFWICPACNQQVDMSELKEVRYGSVDNMEVYVTASNIREIYDSALYEYDFAMEAYAEVALMIVRQNDNPTRIGELMILLQHCIDDER